MPESNIPEEIKHRIDTEAKAWASDQVFDRDKFREVIYKTGTVIGEWSYSLSQSVIEDQAREIDEKDKAITELSNHIETYGQTVDRLIKEKQELTAELATLKSRVLEIAGESWEKCHDAVARNLSIGGPTDFNTEGYNTDKSTYINNLKKELNIQS